MDSFVPCSEESGWKALQRLFLSEYFDPICYWIMKVSLLQDNDYISEKYRNMKNTFKFGTVVDRPSLRVEKKNCNLSDNCGESENHLVLICLRRFGKYNVSTWLEKGNFYQYCFLCVKAFVAIRVRNKISLKLHFQKCNFG